MEKITLIESNEIKFKGHRDDGLMCFSRLIGLLVEVLLLNC